MPTANLRPTCGNRRAPGAISRTTPRSKRSGLRPSCRGPRRCSSEARSAQTLMAFGLGVLLQCWITRRRTRIVSLTSNSRNNCNRNASPAHRPALGECQPEVWWCHHERVGAAALGGKVCHSLPQPSHRRALSHCLCFSLSHHRCIVVSSSMTHRPIVSLIVPFHLLVFSPPHRRIISHNPIVTWSPRLIVDRQIAAHRPTIPPS